MYIIIHLILPNGTKGVQTARFHPPEQRQTLIYATICNFNNTFNDTFGRLYT